MRGDGLESLGLSGPAQKLVLLLNGASAHALPGDPTLSLDEAAQRLRVPERDVRTAAIELSRLRMVRIVAPAEPGTAIESIATQPQLFMRTDEFVNGWQSGADGRALAQVLLDRGPSITVRDADTKWLHWGPRRINPAAFVLHHMRKARILDAAPDVPYIYGALSTNRDTERYCSAWYGR